MNTWSKLIYSPQEKEIIRLQFLFIIWGRFQVSNVDDIVSDERIIYNDITVFTKTQINPSDSTGKIIETLDFLDISFNNNKGDSLILAYGCRNNVAVLDEFNTNGVPIFSFKKHALVKKVFTVMFLL